MYKTGIQYVPKDIQPKVEFHVYYNYVLRL